ncbi:MAG: cobalamin B12-binding domain-containing protein [Halanaerobiales bacterium]|nr:cobalamin B12-binding domain-containing protein [Halanaerobiales bacterium]
MEKKIKVLIAKPGLDGHDRGAKVIARGLKEAGMEVVYTGLRQTPEQIVRSAVQEDVDVIGLSILSGAHTYLFPEIMKRLKDSNRDDIAVIAGGIIPEDDHQELNDLGIKAVFQPGTPISEIVDFIENEVN